MIYMLSNLQHQLKTFVLMFIVLLYQNIAFANIVQTTTLSPFQMAVKDADCNTLIVFDIDDVLLTAKDQILQPTNKEYNNKLALEIQNRIPTQEAENLWSIILLSFQDEVVDPKMVNIIQNLQSRNIKALGLTNLLTGSFGKISSMEDWTVTRLNKHHINFKLSWNNINTIEFVNLTPHDKNRYATFKDGISFASGLPKGSVLKAFLNYVKIKPKKIIFIDDKLSNVESIQSYCLEQKIEFSGFHYTAVKDKLQKPLNEKRAQFQFKILEKDHKWLSDQEADQLLVQ